MDHVADHYLEQLSRYLGPARLQHSQNVAQCARELALRHAPQLADCAELAGILHDHAKRFSGVELIELARKYDIEITPGELATPALLHGKIGAALLSERFGVEDAAVAQAVSDHVTGRTGMPLLSRILFVADQAAADRAFPGIDELRAAAQQDLDEAVFLVVKHKLAYVMSKNRPVEPATIELYNALCEERSGAGGA